MKPRATRPESALVTALAAGDIEGMRRVSRAQLDWGKVGDLAALHQVDALCWYGGIPACSKGRS